MGQRFNDGDVVVIHKPTEAEEWYNDDVYWNEDMEQFDNRIAVVDYYDEDYDGYSLVDLEDEDYVDEWEQTGYNVNDFWFAEDWLEMYEDDNNEIDVSCFESLDINLLR